MMGVKSAEPSLFVNFSLDAAVPRHHLLRQIAESVDFRFVRSLTTEVRRKSSSRGSPSPLRSR
jgi:hypothetical protein